MILQLPWLVSTASCRTIYHSMGTSVDETCVAAADQQLKTR